MMVVMMRGGGGCTTLESLGRVSLLLLKESVQIWHHYVKTRYRIKSWNAVHKEHVVILIHFKLLLYV